MGPTFLIHSQYFFQSHNPETCIQRHRGDRSTRASFRHPLYSRRSPILRASMAHCEGYFIYEVLCSVRLVTTLLADSDLRLFNIPAAFIYSDPIREHHPSDRQYLRFTATSSRIVIRHFFPKSLRHLAAFAHFTCRTSPRIRGCGGRAEIGI